MTGSRYRGRLGYRCIFDDKEIDNEWSFLTISLVCDFQGMSPRLEFGSGKKQLVECSIRSSESTELKDGGRFIVNGIGGSGRGLWKFFRKPTEPTDRFP